jgi:hypothetical protein
MNIGKIIGPLRNPKFAAALLLGSVALSALLTIADPTPIRHSLGLEAAVVAPQTASSQTPSVTPTNAVSSNLDAKSRDKTVAEAPSQMVTFAEKSGN